MDKERIKLHGFTPSKNKELVYQSYRETITRLQEKSPILAAILEQYGSPIAITTKAPVYAGAFFDHDCESSHLLINDESFLKINLESRVGVLAHEAIHFYRNDEQLLCTHEGFDTLFGIATDVCINDGLAKAGFSLPEGALFGEKIIGRNCADADPNDVLEIFLARIGYIPINWEAAIKKMVPKNSVLSIPRAGSVVPF